MELNVINFIKSNKDWKEKLSQKPFFLEYNTNEKYPHLILLKYNQLESDFYNPIVRECRGIILDIADENNPFVACYAFNKFGNYGEGYADNIDWSTARIQEKVDGSILKVWFDTRMSKWMLSTNGTINAFECPLPFAFKDVETFGDAFVRGVSKEEPFDPSMLDFAEDHKLNNEDTYVFELIGPYNKVVVQYPLDVYHIGTRKNKSSFNYEEMDIFIGIKKPKIYQFSSIEETVEFAKTLSSQEEGFVVVDGNWNRVKIKGETYVQLHHLRGDVVTPKRIMTLVLSNEDGEFLNYFPEFSNFFNEVKAKYLAYTEKVFKELCYAEDNWIVQLRDGLATRKDYAQWVQKNATNKSIMFSYADGKLEPEELKHFLANNFAPEKILEWLK